MQIETKIWIIFNVYWKKKHCDGYMQQHKELIEQIPIDEVILNEEIFFYDQRT